MTQDKKKHIDEVTDLLIRADIAYYRDHAPVMTDQEYDILYKYLESLEEHNPDIARPDSPTHGVTPLVVPSPPPGGERAPGGTPGKLRHETPMMSIENTFEREGVESFLGKVASFAGGPVDLVIEKKFDGLAVSLIYENGRLVRAATRGDYEIGEDVTANVAGIPSVPQEITCKDRLDVRGEVMMPTRVFLAINALRQESGEELLASSRNAAAGALRLRDATETAKRGLIFTAYGTSGATTPAGLNTHYGVMLYLAQAGIPCEAPRIVRSMADVQREFDGASESRHAMDFDIDGMVIKVNDLILSERMGFTARSPRAMLAYKFNQQMAVTVVEGIDIQVGRTGALTPVARLAPVIIGGVTVQNATLHNEDEIARLDVRVGDTVTVRRNGDVIPGIIAVDRTKRMTGVSAPYVMPASCPCCGSAVMRRTGESVTRCANQSCGEQKYQRLVHFVSRAGMNIEGVGEQLVRSLYDMQRVSHIDQFYDLTTNDILRVPGYAARSAQNVIDAIALSRNPPLRKLLVALGIRHANEGTAKRLEAAFGSLDAIRSATLEQLTAVDDIGEVVGRSLLDYFRHPDNAAILDSLSRYVTPQSVATVAGGPFTGKTFVITGTLDGMSRTDAQSWIESMGGKVSGSVSKKTDFLLCGTDAGNKLDRARDLGVSVIDLAEAQAMAGDDANDAARPRARVR